MKKLLLLISLFCAFLFMGCFETTQEITLNEDGSGTLRNTNDLGTLISLMKEMQADSKEAGKLEDEVMDTTMSLASQVDSIAGLTDEEKEMMKKGTMQIHMNIKENEFLTTMQFPFTSPAEINAFNQLSAKVTAQALKEKINETPVGSMEGTPPMSSFEDYYKSSYSKGLIVKELDKIKYAMADSDQYLAGMKESAAVGVRMTSTYVINLPKPAKKAEGKNIELSADKKKVTVKGSIEDFFTDPAKLEYRIEY